MPDILKYDVLVIGSLNADLVVRTVHFPRPGETISGDDLQIIPGGKGANQAVAAARQGASVAMVGRVGKDGFGPFLLNSLKSDSVDIANISTDESATGTAMIVVDSSGQNSIVLSAGANGKVTSKDIDALKIKAKVLLLQLEIPLETVIHAAKWGRQNGMIVILNPAPARELPDELLLSADYILPNETELSLLTGLPVRDVLSAEQAAKALLNRGAKNVIVTLGNKGALFVSNKQVSQVNAYPVEVVDTTAAGDAFIGGFASFLVEALKSDSELPDVLLLAPALQIKAVKYANACGALATTMFGAQPSLPTKEEVEKFLS
ncbi:MAG: ribokinase [Chloroflexi bacterium]|nr:ribokinase [Chloroflexota bacterium]